MIDAQLREARGAGVMAGIVARVVAGVMAGDVARVVTGVVAGVVARVVTGVVADIFSAIELAEEILRACGQLVRYRALTTGD